ncbi:MAG: ATP-binding cassette domain-containing protein, partial [Gammaproteobacteria bacterium]|nr:ATP-binding cassette domain-containing protein [Gammaproteobacteria bacterium]
MTPSITVKDVSKSFGGVVANQAVSLSVKTGSITGLIGPNGSGKTTLFNSIVGYHPIDSGSIKFEGKEISQLRVQQIARRGLLRTFQQTRIYAKMNCIENMLISIPHRNAAWIDMVRKYPERMTGRAEDLLEFVGLYS